MTDELEKELFPSDSKKYLEELGKGHKPLSKLGFEELDYSSRKDAYSEAAKKSARPLSGTSRGLKAVIPTPDQNKLFGSQSVQSIVDNSSSAVCENIVDTKKQQQQRDGDGGGGGSENDDENSNGRSYGRSTGKKTRPASAGHTNRSKYESQFKRVDEDGQPMYTKMSKTKQHLLDMERAHAIEKEQARLRKKKLGSNYKMVDENGVRFSYNMDGWMDKEGHVTKHPHKIAMKRRQDEEEAARAAQKGPVTDGKELIEKTEKYVEKLRQIVEAESKGKQKWTPKRCPASTLKHGRDDFEPVLPEEEVQRWPEYQVLDIGDVLTTIEHCWNCEHHNWVTHHNEEKYIQNAQNIQGALVKVARAYPVRYFSLLKPIASEVDDHPHYQDMFRASDPSKHSKPKPYGVDCNNRLGALEVQVAIKTKSGLKCHVLFSKLFRGCWPNIKDIEVLLHKFFNDCRIKPLQEIKVVEEVIHHRELSRRESLRLLSPPKSKPKEPSFKLIPEFNNKDVQQEENSSRNDRMEFPVMPYTPQRAYSPAAAAMLEKGLNLRNSPIIMGSGHGRSPTIQENLDDENNNDMDKDTTVSNEAKTPASGESSTVVAQQSVSQAEDRVRLEQILAEQRKALELEKLEQARKEKDLMLKEKEIMEQKLQLLELQQQLQHQQLQQKQAEKREEELEHQHVLQHNQELRVQREKEEQLREKQRVLDKQQIEQTRRALLQEKEALEEQEREEKRNKEQIEQERQRQELQKMEELRKREEEKKIEEWKKQLEEEAFETHLKQDALEHFNELQSKKENTQEKEEEEEDFLASDDDAADMQCKEKKELPQIAQVTAAEKKKVEEEEEEEEEYADDCEDPDEKSSKASPNSVKSKELPVHQQQPQEELEETSVEKKTIIAADQNFDLKKENSATSETSKSSGNNDSRMSSGVLTRARAATHALDGSAEVSRSNSNSATRPTSRNSGSIMPPTSADSSRCGTPVRPPVMNAIQKQMSAKLAEETNELTIPVAFETDQPRDNKPHNNNDTSKSHIGSAAAGEFSVNHGDSGEKTHIPTFSSEVPKLLDAETRAAVGSIAATTVRVASPNYQPTQPVDSVAKLKSDQAGALPTTPPSAAPTFQTAETTHTSSADQVPVTHNTASVLARARVASLSLDGSANFSRNSSAKLTSRNSGTLTTPGSADSSKSSTPVRPAIMNVIQRKMSREYSAKLFQEISEVTSPEQPGHKVLGRHGSIPEASSDDAADHAEELDEMFYKDLDSELGLLSPKNAAQQTKSDVPKVFFPDPVTPTPTLAQASAPTSGSVGSAANAKAVSLTNGSNVVSSIKSELMETDPLLDETFRPNATFSKTLKGSLPEGFSGSGLSVDQRSVMMMDQTMGKTLGPKSMSKTSFGSANEGVETTYDSIFEDVIPEGSKVEVNRQSGGKWYLGRVTRVRLDNTFDIDYDDGEKESQVAERNVRLLDAGGGEKHENDGEIVVGKQQVSVPAVPATVPATAQDVVVKAAGVTTSSSSSLLDNRRPGGFAPQVAMQLSSSKVDTDASSSSTGTSQEDQSTNNLSKLVDSKASTVVLNVSGAPAVKAEELSATIEEPGEDSLQSSKSRSKKSHIRSSMDETALDFADLQAALKAAQQEGAHALSERGEEGNAAVAAVNRFNDAEVAGDRQGLSQHSHRDSNAAMSKVFHKNADSLNKLQDLLQKDFNGPSSKIKISQSESGDDVFGMNFNRAFGIESLDESGKISAKNDFSLKLKSSKKLSDSMDLEDSMS